jgi:hypothetical protein
MSITPTIYAKARSEVLALFGWKADSLSPDQMLRLDCAVALRLALDDLQGRVVRGESVDMSRMLSASEALSRLLPPAVLAAPPAEADRADPREIMFQTYLGMRRRGELAESYLSPQQRLAAARAKVAAIEAEIAAGSTAITPTDSDIVPPGEIGECYAGIRPGPDDPPRRSPPIIEGKASPAARVPVLGDLVGVVSDPSPADYVEPDGSIRSTPRGRGQYWGPV